jgi:membrane protein implicated in regulation of membrane protease activity
VTGWAAWCLRVAGANGIVNGLGFGGFTIPAMVSLGRGRGILYTFGNPTYGNGPFERIGVPTSVPLLAAFLAACLLQVVGGVLLLWPRRSGIVVSIAGLLLCAPFWWGFDLPFAWLNAAVLLAFLVLAWTVRKRPSTRIAAPQSASAVDNADGDLATQPPEGTTPMRFEPRVVA